MQQHRVAVIREEVLETRKRSEKKIKIGEINFGFA
jgi:hypothetical protein